MSVTPYYDGIWVYDDCEYDVADVEGLIVQMLNDGAQVMMDAFDEWTDCTYGSKRDVLVNGAMFNLSCEAMLNGMYAEFANDAAGWECLEDLLCDAGARQQEESDVREREHERRGMIQEYNDDRL